MLDNLDSWCQLKESLIDFAKPGMDSKVWAVTKDGGYRLQPAVEKAILDHLGKHPDADLLGTTDNFHIIGSMTTNQYLDDSDIDVHVFPKDPSKWDEDRVRAVKAWFESPENLLSIGEHPVEIFVQTNPATDYLSPGFYDIQTRKWEKGPKIVPTDFDPYEDFSDIADDLRASVEDAIKQMSAEDKKKFLQKLEAKLGEIEEDIKKLVTIKQDWVKARRVTEPASPEEALKDIELAKEWKDANALFKMISRYQYITIIKALKDVISDDGQITPDEVNVIKGVLGTPDYAKLRR
jgi:hypothetical protein